jgi:hypothetical protein
MAEGAGLIAQWPVNRAIAQPVRRIVSVIISEILDAIRPLPFDKNRG